MVDEILFCLFYGVGAGIVWLVKGCRTSYFDELAAGDETRNALVANTLFLYSFRIGNLYQ